MKKFIAVLLSAALVLSLTACGSSDGSSQASSEKSAGAAAEAVSAADAAPETKAASAASSAVQASASSSEASPEVPGTSPSKSVETDLADMTWDEILEEAKGQTLTLNVYNADTQVAKYWDKIIEMGRDYDIDVVIVSETADTDARMISDYEDGAVAAYDMTWGYYGYTFKAYYDAGCLWGDNGEQWVKYLPNAQYIDWDGNMYQYDCGLPTNYMESPLMGLTPMLAYSDDKYDASLAWDETAEGEDGTKKAGLFHDLTELYQWVQKYPGCFTYLDLTGAGGFHGKCFVKSILYELTDDGNGGWKCVYDPEDDADTRYEKIEANAQSWYEWMNTDEATQENFMEKASYAWAYLNDLEPYLLQSDDGPYYGSDAYAMADYVNSGVLAASFTTCFSISPKLESDPSYMKGGQAYMMQTSVFASDFMVITKNSGSKAAAMVLANLMLDPTVQADCFGLTGNTYNLDLTKLNAEDQAYFETVFENMLPGTSPSADDLANFSHVDIGGSIGAWLADCWTQEVINK